MTLAVLVAYLLLVLTVGLASHRLFRGTGEDYFLATRTIGPFVLLMSLFGTHMTAFSLLGASGEGYRTGVGVFALMASSSALVVPIVFYTVGMRLWRLGKRHGFVTQVQFFRARWDSDTVGLLLFVFLVALLVPYLLIGVMGGGLALKQIAGVPEWAGSLAVCVVVSVYVAYGGLRGTAWANTFQTLVFMILGGVTFAWIVGEMGGLGAALDRVAREQPGLLVRGDRIPSAKLWSYLCIPLSVGMFPHIFMHWLTARSSAAFRLSIVAYPVCIAAVWVPSVLLGVIGTVAIPGLEGPAANSILVRLIEGYAPPVLAGLLGAGVVAAIMSSLDSQVLSLGTMFTKDILRVREDRQVFAGRAFVGGILLGTYLLSLVASRSIFQFGIWSFSGFAALFPIVLAALFWRRSTKSGVIASILSVAALWCWFFVDGWGVSGYSVAGTGTLPVVVMIAVGAAVLTVVSKITVAPPRSVVERFF